MRKSRLKDDVKRTQGIACAKAPKREGEGCVPGIRRPAWLEQSDWEMDMDGAVKVSLHNKADKKPIEQF